MNEKSRGGVRGKQRREEKNVCVQSREKKELEDCRENNGFPLSFGP